MPECSQVVDYREEYIKKLVKFLTVRRSHDVVIIKENFSLRFMWLIKNMCYIMSTHTSYFLDKNDVWSINKGDDTVCIEVLKRNDAIARQFPVDQHGNLFYVDYKDGKNRAFTPIFPDMLQNLNYLNKLLNAFKKVTYKPVECIWIDSDSIETFPEVFEDLMNFIKYYETLILDKLKQEQENERMARHQRKIDKYKELMQALED